MNIRQVIDKVADQHRGKGWDMDDPEQQKQMANVLADMTYDAARAIEAPISNFAKSINRGMPYEFWRDQVIGDVALFFGDFVGRGADPEIICRAIFDRFSKAVVN